MKRPSEKTDAAYEVIRKRIRSGEYKPQNRMPAMLDLSIDLEMSEHAIRKAIARLFNDGYVTTLAGKGTFVRLAKYWPDTSKGGEET